MPCVAPVIHTMLWPSVMAPSCHPARVGEPGRVADPGGRLPCEVREGGGGRVAREGRRTRMNYETLIVERRGPVCWLIFNRPEALNAHNIPMLEEVPQAWGELDDDGDVRVVVITGRGRGFSVGADVTE